MIKFENTEVIGWEHAIRGMRNPKNSWSKSDSRWTLINENDVEHGCDPEYEYIIGDNDMKLMKQLRNAGTDHRKFMRMITVYVDITAPLYWWKEFDTYKVGTVANSCSTMHKIAAKEFELDDFSHEHLLPFGLESLNRTIIDLNYWRDAYFVAKKVEKPELNSKDIWWQMIQLLPSSYNQKRTVMLNYEVLSNIYKPTSRRHHKLDEWNVDCEGSFCDWINTLPYSELITGEDNDTNE